MNPESLKLKNEECLGRETGERFLAPPDLTHGAGPAAGRALGRRLIATPCGRRSQAAGRRGRRPLRENGTTPPSAVSREIDGCHLPFQGKPRTRRTPSVIRRGVTHRMTAPSEREPRATPHPSSASRGIGGCHLPLEGKALRHAEARPLGVLVPLTA